MKNIILNSNLRGGVLENNNKPTLKNSQKSIKAFSLIELSIVLIIIGLLVAGITGGQSLIEAAKIRSFINEATGYKRAIDIFYAKNERLPSDKNNTGMFNYSSDYSLPFRELYDAGILDFKAEECDKYNEEHGEYEDGYEECDGINIPKSKAFNGGTFYYNSSSNDFYDFNDFFNYLSYDINYGFLPLKIFKQIDEKMDDGIPDEGNAIVIGNGFIGDAYPVILNYDDENQIVSEILFKLDL